MRIRILSAWKQAADLKEREAEYLKRLGRYVRIELVEVKGEKGDGKETLRKEGERLIEKIGGGALVIALLEGGEPLDSKGFSRLIAQEMTAGRSGIDFIVGSAAGMDEALREKAARKLSLSPMTYPHQLARVMLAEQLYRAFTLIRGEPYHK